VLSAEVYSACGYEPPYYVVEIEFQYKHHQPQTTSEVFFDFADVATFLAEFGLTPTQVGATVCP
jgi:AraC-like DNA-binding protein